MAALDISSLLKQVWDAIRQIRTDITTLQMQERPAETSGPHANRPTTSLRTGQRYFSTDTGAYEYWTGSGWSAVAGGGGGTSPDYVTLTNSSGATIPAFALVGYGGSGSITLANSTASGDVPAIGITTAAIASGASGQVQTGGILTMSGLFTGAYYFSSTGTPGAFTTVPPSATGAKHQYIGRPLSSTTFLIEISEPVTLAASNTSPQNDNVLKRNSSSGRLQEVLVAVSGYGFSFPPGPSDGQRYFHTTYRSWFIYNSTDVLWRQEAPGVFSGSFPTVSTADNTVAPKIQVARSDKNNTIFWWDGAYWHYATNQIVLLAAPARLIDDASATRTAGYNTLITAVNTNTLVGGIPTPAKMAAIYAKVTLIGNAVGGLSATFDNPDSPTGAQSIAGYSGTTVNGFVTGLFICGVSSAGQIKFTLGTGSISRYVIDVVGYQLDLI